MLRKRRTPRWWACDAVGHAGQLVLHSVRVHLLLLRRRRRPSSGHPPCKKPNSSPHLTYSLTHPLQSPVQSNPLEKRSEEGRNGEFLLSRTNKKRSKKQSALAQRHGATKTSDPLRAERTKNQEREEGRNKPLQEKAQRSKRKGNALAPPFFSLFYSPHSSGAALTRPLLGYLQL